MFCFVDKNRPCFKFIETRCQNGGWGFVFRGARMDLDDIATHLCCCKRMLSIIFAPVNMRRKTRIFKSDAIFSTMQIESSCDFWSSQFVIITQNVILISSAGFVLIRKQTALIRGAANDMCQHKIIVRYKWSNIHFLTSDRYPDKKTRVPAVDRCLSGIADGQPIVVFSRSTLRFNFSHRIRAIAA